MIKELKKKNLGQIKSGEYSAKIIIEPSQSEKFAEFLGIFIGDGHVSKNGVRICGNKNEIYHHEYIRLVVKEIFNLKANTFVAKSQFNSCITDIYSRRLVKYLEKMGFKKGNKIINKTRIPSWILGKKEYSLSALRGLFDTDGGVYLKQKEYKRIFIEFQNHCPQTMEDIAKLIIKSGYTPSKSSINIRIQNQREVEDFFQNIGSCNPKNIIRYQIFLKNKSIPLKERLTEKIIRYKGPQPF